MTLTLWFHPVAKRPQGWSTWLVRGITRSPLTHVAPEILGCQLNLTMTAFRCRAYWAQKAPLHRLWTPLFGLRLRGTSSSEPNLEILDLVLTGDLDGTIPNLTRFLGRKLGIPCRQSMNCVSTTNVALAMYGLSHLQGDTPDEIYRKCAPFSDRVASSDGRAGRDPRKAVPTSEYPVSHTRSTSN